MKNDECIDITNSRFKTMLNSLDLHLADLIEKIAADEYDDGAVTLKIVCEKDAKGICGLNYTVNTVFKRNIKDNDDIGLGDERLTAEDGRIILIPGAQISMFGE